MKKLLVVLMVLSMASAANAALMLSVGGDIQVDEITLLPSEIATIDIQGDGTEPLGIFFMGVSAGGPASLDFSSAAMIYQGNDSMFAEMDDPDLAGAMGITTPFELISLSDVPPIGTPQLPLTGLLVDLITLHCNGPGDVVVSIFNGNTELLDSILIHQIPEPITMVLLGLGGLFLRRRK